jgi:hypothetical protein
MNKSTLLLSALAAGLACGVTFPALGAEPKNPPPPVYVGQTPTPPPAGTSPAPAGAAPAGNAPANAAPPPSAPAQSGAAKLEKLAMPIALHPDPLIAIILPASAYPLEIVQAARFVRNTNNISKIDEQSWDDNVKAVAKFPALIEKMDADLPWTMELGQAFVEQPKELMDTIQALRAKAQQAGTLKSSPQQVVTVTNVVVLQTNVTQVVTVTNQIVQVQPSNPQVVYVPSYPTTVYAPPPAYDPWAPLVTFGVGMAMGAIIANNCDWHGGGVWYGGHGDVDIDINNDINIDRDNVNIDRGNRGDRTTQRSGTGNRQGTAGARPTQQKWQPDQSRMRASGAPTTAQSRDARGWGGGSTQPAQRPGGGGAGTARASQLPSSGGGARPGAQPSVSGGQRPSSAPRSSSSWQSPAGSGNRAASSSSVNRGSSPSSSAFSGAGSGGARDFSSRGASSRGGGGMRGGGGRGGGGGRR